MVAGASGCLLTFILGYNSLNDRLKDLEKEEREWVRDQEKKEEELVELERWARDSCVLDLDV